MIPNTSIQDQSYPNIGSQNIVFLFLTGDVPRVNGQLAVSRAFGDKSLKTHLRSDPDVKDSSIDDHTDVLVLASDGLWKVNKMVFCISK